MTKKTENEHLITLEFPGESKKYIEDLQERTNCGTKAEVFQLAMNTLDFVVNAIARGRLILIDSTGKEREVLLFPPSTQLKSKECHK